MQIGREIDIWDRNMGWEDIYGHTERLGKSGTRPD